jgi:hypothetical protein
VGVKLPIDLSGIPEDVRSLFELTAIDIVSAGGRYHETGIHSENGSYAISGIAPTYFGPDWLILRIRRSLYESLKNGKVDLKATAVASLHRAGQTARLPVGAKHAVTGAGRCSSAVVEAPGYAGERVKILKVVCESPAGFPLVPTVAFSRRDGPRAPSVLPRLIVSGTSETLVDVSGPWETVLSPLARVQTSIPLVQASRDALELEITPDSPVGWAVVEFELHDIRLSDYEVHQVL